MAKAKKYFVKIKQKNDVSTISLFTKQEICERLQWWLRDFDEVIISGKEIRKEIKF